MFKFFRSDKALGGIATAYVAGMVMMLVIVVLVGGVNRPKFLSSSASGNVRYIGPAECGPGNPSPRCIKNNPLKIVAPEILPSGVRGQAYSFAFKAVGGVPPYTFAPSTSPVNDLYPCCLISLSNDGLFASAPGSSVMPYAGTYRLGVVVSDSQGRSAQGVFSYTIEPEKLGGPLTITGRTELPSGTVGESYYYQFQFSGGKGGPYTWALDPAMVPNPTYPAGCMRFSSTGQFSGCENAPTMPYAGNYKVGVVLSSGSESVKRVFNFTINPVDATQDDKRAE